MTVNIKPRKKQAKLSIWSSFLYILAIFSCSTTHAQMLRVADSESRQFLSDVYISTDHPNLQLKTDSLGYADLSHASPQARFLFTHIGYDTLIMSYSQLKNNNFQVYMRPLSFGLQGVVVSASRWEQNEASSMERIAVLRSGERKLIQPQTSADWLASTGEVFVQKSQQGGGSPMIRGFSANRLMYAVDGVRMNNAIFRAGNLHNVISLDPYATAQLEILFGPSSVLYGSDAIGGVMSFISLPLQYCDSDSLLITCNVQGRISSANREKTGHIHLQMGRKRIAWTASVTRYEAGDLRMGSFGPAEFLRPNFVIQNDSGDSLMPNPDPKIQTPSGYHQWNILQKLGIKPTKDVAISYTYHGSFNPGFARYDRLIERSATGQPISSIWEYGPQNWQMHLLNATYEKANICFDKARLQIAHQGFAESRMDRPWAGSNRYILRKQSEQVNAWSIQMDMQRQIKNLTLYYGGEWVFNKVISKGSGEDIRDKSILDLPDRYPAADWNSLGFYAKAAVPLSKEWFWEGGIRYNKVQMLADFDRLLAFYPFPFNRAFQSHNGLTAGTGLRWKLNPRWQFLWRASTGFRAPNVDDLGKLFDFVAGEIVVPNTYLRPEYAYHSELGATYTHKFIRFNAGSFITWLDRAMVRRPFMLNGSDSLLFNGTLSRIYAVQNAAYARIFGGNFGLEINPLSGLSASLSCQIQRGIEEMADGSKSAARHAAPIFGQGSVSYRLGHWHIMGQVFLNEAVPYERLNEEERQKPALYAKDDLGNPWSPSWYRIDFRVQYRLRNASFVHLAIENISDQRYRTYSSGIAAAGRNLILAFQAEF